MFSTLMVGNPWRVMPTDKSIMEPMPILITVITIGVKCDFLFTLLPSTAEAAFANTPTVITINPID